MKKIFYIADTHFGDKTTFRWDIRNSADVEVFASLEEKTNAIIERWNNKVSNRDHVYILGDIFSTNQDQAKEILSQLNGAKHFIFGNHDKQWLQDIANTRKMNILECVDYKTITDDGRSVVLSHYPIAFWKNQHSGTYHIYGHLHNSFEYDEFQMFGQRLVDTHFLPEFRAYNVGAMIVGYEPKTLDELIEFYGGTDMTKQQFKEADFAGKKWREKHIAPKNPNVLPPSFGDDNK